MMIILNKQLFEPSIQKINKTNSLKVKNVIIFYLKKLYNFLLDIQIDRSPNFIFLIF
jgi:hypothetical protein